MTNGTVGRADYITMTDGTQGLQAASLRVVSATRTSGTAPVCTVAAPTVTLHDDAPLGEQHHDAQSHGRHRGHGRGLRLARRSSTAPPSTPTSRTSATRERDEVQTIINAGRDLTITKSDAPDPVCARSWPDAGNTDDCRGGLHYTFVVGNSGIQEATNVVVRDPLPPGTTYDDATTSSTARLL